MLIVQMVSTCNFWLNIYPPTDGVTRNINPRELITGVKIDYKKHIRAEFGEYVQVHEEHNNTMQTRTTGAIATKPTGNAQGGHWFYSLTTGRMLDRRQWTPLPMPADVIDRVNTLAKACPAGLTFTNMRNEVYDEDAESDSDKDSNDDSDYDSQADSSTNDDDDYNDSIAGVDMPTNNSDPPDPPDANANETHNNEDTDDDGDDNDDDNGDAAVEAHDPIDNEFEDDAADTSEDDVIAVPTQLKKLTDATGALPPILESRTRQQAQDTGESFAIVKTVTNVTKKQRKFRKELELRLLKKYEEETKKKLRNKLRNEKKKTRLKDKKCTLASPLPIRVGTIKREDSDEFGDLRDQLRSEQKPGVLFPHDSCLATDLTPGLEAIALTQYTLKRGLKEFGNDGIAALGIEMEQLHTRKVAKLVDGNSLTWNQKRATLQYLMFLSKKRCGW
jgi:hypothetical protein